MYETLLREAEKGCIEVVELPLKGKLKGIYFDKIIAIDNKLVQNPKTCRYQRMPHRLMAAVLERLRLPEIWGSPPARLLAFSLHPGGPHSLQGARYSRSAFFRLSPSIFLTL